MRESSHGHDTAEPAAARDRPSPRPVEAAGSAGAEAPGTSLAAPIQEAESLHAALADARARTARLVAGLRRQRKQSRSVREALKSLRELRLPDVVA